MLCESFKGSVTLTVIGSIEPTKLTQVTADLSDVVPSTAIVNMGGGDVVLDEDVSEEVREEVKD